MELRINDLQPFILSQTFCGVVISLCLEGHSESNVDV